jgi:hypothetical protein
VPATCIVYPCRGQPHRAKDPCDASLYVPDMGCLLLHSYNYKAYKWMDGGAMGGLEQMRCDAMKW